MHLAIQKSACRTATELIRAASIDLVTGEKFGNGSDFSRIDIDALKVKWAGDAQKARERIGLNKDTEWQRRLVLEGDSGTFEGVPGMGEFVK